MKQIKMKRNLEVGEDTLIGDRIYTVADKVAEGLVKIGHAVVIADVSDSPPPKVEPPEEKKEDEGEVETAAAPGAPENAMSRRGRARNPAK